MLPLLCEASKMCNYCFGQTPVLQVCDLHAIKSVLCVQLCPAERGAALLRLIEEEQMVFVSCQHQSPLPPTRKWICGASQHKKTSEWREETEAEERGGQAGRGLGGTVRSSGSSGQNVQMCECERGFRFWVKACLGERGFRRLCVGVSAGLIISEAATAGQSAEKHGHFIGFELKHLFAFGYVV